jgi:hypothetical protein
MKTLTYLTLMFFLTMNVHAQKESEITVQLRGGYDFDKDIVIAPSVSFRAHGFALTPDLIIHWSNDKPVEAGMRLSYQAGPVEFGYGRYAVVYSTDKYDEDKNDWGNNFFVQYNKHLLRQDWFIQAEYMNSFRLTLGVKGLIAKLQND